MIKTLRRKQIQVGAEDNGRRMSLDQFDRAIGQEGYLYELNKGVIEVSDVPELKHGMKVQEVRDQLVAYRSAHPGAINYIAGSNDAKVLLAESQSERHPDILVYLTPPPDVDDVWSLWVPKIVVEVVSKSSMKRDYEDKPGEYLQFGVDEYWIVDSYKQQLTVLIRWRASGRKRSSSRRRSTRLGICRDFRWT